MATLPIRQLVLLPHLGRFGRVGSPMVAPSLFAMGQNVWKRQELCS